MQFTKPQHKSQDSHRLEAILNHTVDGIMTLDEGWLVESVNPAVERLFGYQASEMIACHASKFIKDISYISTDSLATQILSIVGIHKNGHSLPIEVSYNSVEMPADFFRIVVIRDITERTLYEKALRASEAKTQKLSLVASRTNNAVIMTNAQGYIDWVNESFSRLTGYAQDEVSGKTILDCLAPRNPNTAGTLERFIQKNEAFNMELQTSSQSGQPLWFYLEWQAIFDIDAEAIGFMAVLTDISEQKEAQRLLERERDFALKIMNTVTEGICVLSKDWLFEYVNSAYERMVGYSAQELIGKNVLFLSDKPDDEAWALRKEERLKKQSGTYESQLRHANGKLVDVIISSVPRFQADTFLGTISTIKDVSKAKQEAQELIDAKNTAEAANRAKNDFLSRMSHELRTPLNAILGFAQLLELDELSQDQSENVDRILGAGRHLLDLINEVLDISRIETGSISLTIEAVDSERVLSESLTLMQPLAKTRNIRIFVDAHDKQKLMGDSQRLKQVLLNLLSNAVKYNRESGQIFVAIEQQGQQVRISVRDTGYGIPAEKQDRLFIPFDRLDKEQSSIEGSGIGLALSKRLVEVMNGSMGVETKLDEGTTFWIDLPAAPTLSEETAEDLSSDVLRIIYIEDDLPNVALVKKVFSKLANTHVLTAMQGQIGLELIRDERPDVVLLDLNLPDISGEEVLQRLKASEETKHLPVIILSADATEATTQRLLAGGAYAYLDKPLNVVMLMQLIEGIKKAKEERYFSAGAAETIDLLRLSQKLLNDRPKNQQLNPEQIQVFQDLQAASRMLMHLWKASKPLDTAFQELLSCLARASEYHLDPSGQHGLRVGRLSAAIAKSLDCESLFTKQLFRAAQFHDIGGIAVAGTILLKPDALSESERTIMQLHCEVGSSLLAEGQSALFALASEIALNHHERWDGSGYPEGLVAQEIPLAARIVAVADVYDALIHERPYKASVWTHEEAMQYLQGESTHQFDPEVIQAFKAIANTTQQLEQVMSVGAQLL